MDKTKVLQHVKDKICSIVDDIRPYEKIEIIADSTGSPDKLIIHREQKIMIQTLILALNSKK